MRFLIIALAAGCAPLPQSHPLPPPTSELILSVDGLVAGAPTTWTVEGLAPGERAYILRGGATDGLACPSIGGGLCVNLSAPVLLTSATANGAGIATVSVTVPSNLPEGVSTAFQAVALRGTGNTDSAKSNRVERSILAQDAVPVSADSALVITEIMANPSEASDSDGEWFEVHNLGSQALDLQGLQVSDDGSAGFTVTRALILGPDSAAVLARSQDLADNGDLHADYGWTGSFSLSNSSDTIRISAGGTVLDDVSWSGDITAGVSRSLAPSRYTAQDNDGSQAWCDALDVMANGELGTPGEPNSACGVCGDALVDPGEDCDGSAGCPSDCQYVDSCGDGFVQAGEQCDLGGSNGTMGVSCALDCTEWSPVFSAETTLVDIDNLFARDIGIITVDDWDGDSIPDVLVTGTSNPLGPARTTLTALPGRGDGSVVAPLHRRTSFSELSDLVVVDFDGDGYLDIVGTIERAHSTVIQYGGPNGLSDRDEDYVQIHNMPFGAEHNSQISITDLDGNGVLDIVVVDGTYGNVQAYYGGATSGYFIGARTNPFAGSGALPLEMALEDVDGDSLSDLIVLYDNGNLVVFPTQATGGFGVAEILPLQLGVYDQPSSFLVADLTEDGANDLVVLDADGAMLVLIQNSGQLAPPVLLDWGSTDAYAGLALGDLDGDGHNDIITTRRGTSELLWRPGLAGAGLFGAVESEPLPPRIVPLHVAAADLDLDGDDDIVVGGEWESIAIFESDGGPTIRDTVIGTFLVQLPNHDPEAVHQIAIADITNDGIPDIVGRPEDGYTMIFEGRGDATVYDTSTIELVSAGPNVLTIDLNSDGLLDTVESTTSRLWVRLGLEEGDVSDNTMYVVPGCTTPVAGDLDNDGDIDVVCVGDNWTSLLNDGQGTLTEYAVAATNGGELDPALADLDGDGLLDLASRSSGGSYNVFVRMGMGTGGFDTMQAYPTSVGSGGLAPNDLVVSDFSGDGVLDLLTYNATQDLSLFIGSGSGDFAAATSVALPFEPSAGSDGHLAVSDLDGDGHSDIVLALEDLFSLRVLRGFGNGTFGAPSTVALQAPASGLTLGDLDEDGHPDVVVGQLGASAIEILLQE